MPPYIEERPNTLKNINTSYGDGYGYGYGEKEIANSSQKRFLTFRLLVPPDSTSMRTCSSISSMTSHS